MTRENRNAAIAGYVLAGGASSRFGRDKALAQLGPKNVLARTCDLVSAVTGGATVIAPPHRYDMLDLALLDDRWPGEGPLGGVLTALHATAERSLGSRWNFILSCDMPFLTTEWLAYMIERAELSEADVIAPRSEYGLEPLCACWRTSALATLQGAFDEGVRKVTEAMKRLRMEVLDEAHWKRFDTSGRLFWNMNTQQDYEDALGVWKLENE